MAKKSLAEQIAELSKPQTDFDIEDTEFRQPEESESENSNDDEAGNDHYVKVGDSKLRKNIEKVALGGKYKGHVTSRQDLVDDEAEESGEEPSEPSEDEEDEEEESDSGASLRSNSSDESEPEEDEQEDEDLVAKRSKLKTLLTQERKHIINRLSQSTSNDSIKGFAILQQQKMFDSIIDSRLKIQKALTNSNQLPINFQALKSEKLSTKKTNSLIESSTEKCYDLLDSIFQLRNKLNEKDGTSTTPNPKKRSLSTYLETTSKHDSILNKYRSSVLIKWSAKIQNSSGSTAINNGKFKAINQNAEQQVSNNLSDMDRLVKKTKLNRRNITPLAIDYYTKNFTKDDEKDLKQDEDDYNPDIPRQINNNENKNQLIELNSIFDDEDFYRVLLNDLVDKKIQSTNPANGLTYALRSAQKAHKLKKNVDTKASKGRKLRYQIQEPISNFETPQSNWKWNDDQIDEFFASLLGQKVNMNELEDEHSDDDRDSDIIDNDNSIKLFG